VLENLSSPAIIVIGEVVDSKKSSGFYKELKH
jgi:siroheme synthase